MPIGLISAEGVPVRRNSGKPKLLLRGRRRKAAIHLVKALQVMANQDFAENRRAALNKYSPFFALGNPNSNYNIWAGKLIARLEEVLKAKA